MLPGCYNVCMKRTHLFLPEPTQARLRALSDDRGLPVAELMRRAIDEWLERQQAPAVDAKPKEAR